MIFSIVFGRITVAPTSRQMSSVPADLRCCDGGQARLASCGTALAPMLGRKIDARRRRIGWVSPEPGGGPGDSLFGLRRCCSTPAWSAASPNGVEVVGRQPGGRVARERSVCNPAKADTRSG